MVAISIETIIWAGYAYALLSAVFIILVLTATPAIPFIMARFSKTRAVLAVIHKGNRLSFVSAKYSAGSFTTKKHGIYDETSNSAYYSHKSLVFFAPEYYAHTLPALYPRILQALRKLKARFTNYEQYLQLVKANHPDAQLNLSKTETIRMGDVLHMFPAIDDPHVREKEKAAEVIIERKLKDGNPRKWLMMLLIGGIVAFIIWKLFAGGAPQEAVNVVCKYPDIVKGGAEVAAQAIAV